MPNTSSVTAVTAPPAAAPVTPVALGPEAPPEGYLGRAFLLQYNLILLGGAMLFALAFASFAPLVAGAVLELAWLVVAPRTAAFRRWVDHRSSEERRARIDSETQSSLAPLDAAYRSRHAALGQQSQEITRLLSDQLGVHGVELDVVREKLAELGLAFARFSALHEQLSRFVTETPVTDIQQEISKTRGQLTSEKDLAVRVTVRQALALAERRLSQWERIGNTRRAVEIQLDTLEKSFSYVRSRAMGLAPAPEVHRDIDALLAQVRSLHALELEAHETVKVA